ncbi:MAG: hypothetical protein J7L14_01800 [Candidatus Diapherotrites archaeon]|nr:hypothetical protein [Candidatus Diapherotrites archaeon]
MPLQVSDRIFVALNELDKVASGNWRELSKREFSARIEEALQRLNKLRKLINEAKLKAKLKGIKVDVGTFEDNLDKLIIFLERNLKLEKAKDWTKKLQREISEEEKELQREVQRKILEFVITSRIALERILIGLRKQIVVPESNAIKLLEMKEKEIQELRAKRTTQNFGQKTEETSEELRSEFSEYAAEIKSKASEFSRELIQEARVVERAANEIAKISSKYSELYNSLIEAIEKAKETIKLLQKEREDARNAVMQIEAETIRLRNAYANELLGLQAERERIRKEIEAEFKEKLNELEKRNKEKEAIIEQLKISLSEKNSEINSLKEELHYTKNLLKAIENEKKVADIELNSLKRKVKSLERKLEKKKRVKKSRKRKTRKKKK